jgi:hypothetical protein
LPAQCLELTLRTSLLHVQTAGIALTNTGTPLQGLTVDKQLDKLFQYSLQINMQ